MNFDFTEEQQALRAEVRKLFGTHASPDKLRQRIDSGESWDRALWARMGEMGLQGAAIAEEFGGAGLSELELCVIAEETGRCVAPVPFLSSTCVAAEAIRLFGNISQRKRWLPGLASGEIAGTYGFDELGREGVPAEPATFFADGTMSGSKSPVPDAAAADLLVVAARDAADVRLFVVEARQPGVALAALDGFDLLRPHARIELHAAEAEVLPGLDGRGFQTLLARAATYVAFEQVGGAEACLHMARDYVLTRSMFGRQLGSYQAVKHRLADMLMAIELARSNAFYAAWAVRSDAPDLSAAAAAARVSASQAYEMAARESLQLHGGFGYTWEANCGFHVRRARLLSLNLGAPDLWVERVMEPSAQGLGSIT